MLYMRTGGVGEGRWVGREWRGMDEGEMEKGRVNGRGKEKQEGRVEGRGKGKMERGEGRKEGGRREGGGREWRGGE